jgi:hypothetical protein
MTLAVSDHLALGPTTSNFLRAVPARIFQENQRI